MEPVTPVGMVGGPLAVVLAMAGCGFFLAGTVGLLRLPDFFTRAHAAAKCDSVGAVLILLAVALGVGSLPDAAKVLALAVLVVVASPTTCHALARAAWLTGLKPWQRDPGS